MTRRLLTSIIAVSAAVFTLGVTQAGAVVGGGGRVEGRITVDGKPVVGERVSLSVGRSAGGPPTATDDKGRFVFRSVQPGKYKLNTGLSLSAGEQTTSSPKCKIPGGYKVLSIPLAGTTRGTILVASVESQKAFSVEEGETVKRNIKMNCKPDVAIVPPPSTGGGGP